MSARRVRTPSEGEEATKRRNRLRAIDALLDRSEPIAPTHAALVSKLGGESLAFAPVDWAFWARNTRAAWSALSSDAPLAGDVGERIASGAKYPEETGADFVATMRTMATLGPREESEVAAIRRESAIFGDDFDGWMRLPPPHSPKERFDGYIRVMVLHGERAYERQNGQRRAFTPNHATDLTMLHHLGDGLVLLTQDYERIEDVDASGSFQAPWVRTVGELLEGLAPSGPPFGMNARRAHAKHRQRRRKELRERDERATRGLRPQSAPPPPPSSR